MADSYVCSGAIMQCTMGDQPAQLTVLPSRTVLLCGKPMANISDHVTKVNLAPFGRCRSLGFPATAAATAAHLGKLTPMPCMHNTPDPWIPGKSDYFVKGQPALLKSCKCICKWGGVISIVSNGQVGEGVQYVPVIPKDNFPHPQKFISDNKPKQKKSEVSNVDTSVQQNNIKKQTLLDELILEDAYWEKDGMKIRFIPYQMEVSLKLIFSYKYHDNKHNRSKAKFNLKFDIPDTKYEEKNQGLIVTGIQLHRLIEKDNKSKEGKTSPLYYCIIPNFSSDLAHVRKTSLKDEPIDNLILHDVYWEKDGMKIRFIPYQMELDTPLILVFSFEYDNFIYSREKAEFRLSFDIPDTIYSQENSEFIITGSYLLEHDNRLKDENGEELTDKDGRFYYCCEIEHFSSDLTNAKLKE